MTANNPDLTALNAQLDRYWADYWWCDAGRLDKKALQIKRGIRVLDAKITATQAQRPADRAAGTEGQG